ncbi:MAG TPA: cation transporter [Gemmatimonadaceae bacterium]|nr:cation transporter [Gemmatimonadaceae bacterium]
MTKLTLDIGGMSCGHCVAQVKKTLATLEGVEVTDVKVGSAVIEYDPSAVTTATIAEALDEQGYALTGAR